MTTKDWKKTGKMSFADKKSSKEMIIYLKEYSIGKLWVVIVTEVKNVGREYIIEKSFKTKQQALKFARTYMRKH